MFDECVCDWGKMVRQILWVGYGASALEAVNALPDIGMEFRSLTSRRRKEILQSQLDAWPVGQTVEDFCSQFGITRARYDNLGLKRQR